MEYPSLDKPTAGAFRFNTDRSQLEIYDGNQWTGVLATSPEIQTGGTRGVYTTGSPIGTLEYINVSTTGNAISFGSLTDTAYEAGACSSRTRMVMGLGYVSPTYTNRIDYITFTSTGNSQDFADLTKLSNPCGSSSSATRGLFFNGRDHPSGTTNNIDYVTIASQGNAKEFGDAVFSGTYQYGTASPTRGVHLGGRESPTGVNTMQYITFATTGNAADFGDLSYTSEFPTGTCSNSVRGFYAGGSPQMRTDILYFQIATLGNTQDFGDLTQGRRVGPGGMASSTRGVFGGGKTGSPVVDTVTMDFVTIATQGDAVDFGNLTAAAQHKMAVSNGHGGLG